MDVGYAGAGVVNGTPFPGYPGLTKYLDGAQDVLAQYNVLERNLDKVDELMMKGAAFRASVSLARDDGSGVEVDGTAVALYDHGVDDVHIIAALGLHRRMHEYELRHVLGDRVVVQPMAREEMSSSGIVLPDTANKEKPQEGEIIAAGPGRLTEDGDREPMDVKVGDKVLYAKYAGTEFKVDDEELLIVSQKDILAVVED